MLNNIIRCYVPFETLVLISLKERVIKLKFLHCLMKFRTKKAEFKMQIEVLFGDKAPN